jgi:hypothetical protein
MPRLNVVPRRAPWVLAGGILLAPWLLGAAPVVRVRGAAKIGAAAFANEDAVVLSGSVVDDTGRPVGGASLRVRGLATDGASVALSALGGCADPTLSAGARAGTTARRGEQVIRADPTGRFCVSAEASGLASLAVSFVDEHGLLDAAEEKIPVDRTRRAVELRILPVTAALELERDQQRLAVTTRTQTPLAGAPPPLPLAVYAITADVETLIAQGACPLNGETELVFPTAKLPTPGPVELVLRFAGSSSLQPAEARRRVLATARVRLALSRAPEAADPSEGVVLDVALGSAAGAVETGSVEARLDGQTVGIAPVERGAARVLAQFLRSGTSARLELRYLPTAPWWRQGEALSVEVPLVARGRWTSLAWLLVLSALASFLVWGWRRPERTERPRTGPDEPRPRVAGVHVVKRDDGYIGWRGVVRDAHDELPVEDALVSLVERGAEPRVHARAVADRAGRFELWAAAGGELELVVTARWHSDFSCPTPPHGELLIDLVSRRRHVLGRLVRWAERRGPLNRGRAEPTPGDVKRHGRRARNDDVADWAAAVEAAAYGPRAVDETTEHDVIRQEPPDPAEPRERRR